MHKDYFETNIAKMFYVGHFSMFNDNKEVDLIVLQIMHYLLLQ
jgi:hypothetical protein